VKKNPAAEVLVYTPSVFLLGTDAACVYTLLAQKYSLDMKPFAVPADLVPKIAKDNIAIVTEALRKKKQQEEEAKVAAEKKAEDDAIAQRNAEQRALLEQYDVMLDSFSIIAFEDEVMKFGASYADTDTWLENVKQLLIHSIDMGALQADGQLKAAMESGLEQLDQMIASSKKVDPKSQPFNHAFRMEMRTAHAKSLNEMVGKTSEAFTLEKQAVAASLPQYS
jgi:hypothetical protein